MCSRSTRAQEDASEVERERTGATTESGASHLEDALPLAGAVARRLATSSADARNTGRAARWRLFRADSNCQGPFRADSNCRLAASMCRTPLF
eukprot:6850190-Heterocapsa_arctica.AAC.1